MTGTGGPGQLTPVLRVLLVSLAVLAACVPLTFVITFATLPLWSWVERSLGIEAVGHSGPADWCFELVYGVTVTVVGAILLRRYRRAPGE